MAADRGSPRHVYDAAAAERTAGRAAHRRGPGRLGVHVIDAEPEHLPVALTDHYLLLKGRGLL